MSVAPTSAPTAPAAPKADLAGLTPTALYAGLAGLLIVGVLVVHGFNILTASEVLGRLLAGGTITRIELAVRNLGTFIELGLVVGATLAWAAWASLVIGNIPRLGIAYPNLTPRWAFFEHIIPGVNVFRAPAAMRQILTHLPGVNGPDEGWFALWVAGLLAAAIVPRVAYTAIGFVAPDEDVATRLATVMDWALYAGLFVSAAAAIVLLVTVERRQAAKARELVGAVAPASSTTG